MQLKMSYEELRADITVVRVGSDGQGGAVLDDRFARELCTALVEVVDDGRLVLVVDLSAVDVADTMGSAVLVAGLQRVHLRGGTLALVVTSERVRAGLSKVGPFRGFRIHDAVPSAVATLAADCVREGAEKGIEQRSTALEERARERRAVEQGVVTSGDHAYEHLSEDITLVRVGGDTLDGFTVPPVRKLLVDLVVQGRLHVVLDLTALDHINTSGLDMLIGALKRVRAHDGGLVLVVRKDSVLKMFRLTGLIKVFHIFDTVGPAVEHLGRNVPEAHV
ncbi:STAS domain-containing protein [Streptomyces sp. SPB162]|uniref:STAS domain-containing protein n=1 Tax=Streptomyces sp. SPB162 TaxID=2940560 RepID=UPI0024065AEE|nr:STAS domain-containing protein [Streptomyces sp. SPB162]MDF9811440.1 anti-anti-sigma factor [Streptomyces sp. SPB162]